MKPTIVRAENPKSIIQPSSWGKKKLADVHLDAMLYCEFRCAYCSSDAGMHLKMRKRSNDQIVRDAAGRSFDPHADKDVTITYGDDFVQVLEAELDAKRRRPRHGKTLV